MKTSWSSPLYKGAVVVSRDQQGATCVTFCSLSWSLLSQLEYSNEQSLSWRAFNGWLGNCMDKMTYCAILPLVARDYFWLIKTHTGQSFERWCKLRSIGSLLNHQERNCWWNQAWKELEIMGNWRGIYLKTTIISIHIITWSQQLLTWHQHLYARLYFLLWPDCFAPAAQRH